MTKALRMMKALGIIKAFEDACMNVLGMR